MEKWVEIDIDFEPFRIWLDRALIVAVALVVFLVLFILTRPRTYNPFASQYLPVSDDGETRKKKARTSVMVVVLGDIGRSPRMQYHTLSLANHEALVEIVGYKDSEILPELEAKKNVSIVALSPPPQFLRTSNPVLFMLFGPLKVVWQTLDLYHALGYRTRPSRFLLLQNPPSIPTLAVALFQCYLRSTKLVVDWHNLGFSVLAQKLGRFHPLVWIASFHETYMASKAHAHLCVSNAMKEYLKELASISATTLHDRPAAMFKPLTATQRITFLQKLPETVEYAKDLKRGSWKLVVSSTSWTLDEDFSLLLAALLGYSARAKETKLPKLLVIITGKGPQKDHYMQKIAELEKSNRLAGVVIATAWLSLPDYASLLGAADLGVCLHKSTSGVDLPMKVVDMFGAGLPVLGWDQYESWPELLKQGVNGEGFSSSKDLEELLIGLLRDEKSLAVLKKGAIAEGSRRWDNEWDAVAEKVFKLD